MYFRIFIIACVNLFVLSLQAGNTGKIAGIVTDSETGLPLIGANVFVVDTQLGAATNLEGKYEMLNVPSGTYSLRVSYIGYHTLTIRNIVVNAGLTTNIDVELSPDTIELPTLEVFAERPLVQRDITHTRRTISREDIELTPGMISTLDVFRLQAGVFIDQAAQTLQLGEGMELQVRDQSVRNVHIRGGRGGEILFMIDGMPVTHPIYGGRSVLDLDMSAVSHVELLTGAFNAEYGQAQSGVVNITTRSGTEHFQGGFEYKNDHASLFADSRNTDYLNVHLGGPIPIDSGPLSILPGEMSYFISGNANLTNTAFNNNRTREKISILGLDIKERQDNNAGLNARLDWNISPALRITLGYRGSWKKWSNFNWLWINYPDNTASYSRTNQNLYLAFNHVISRNTFYNVRIGYLHVNYRGSLNGKRPFEFWRYYKDEEHFEEGVGYTYDEWNRNYAGEIPYRVRPLISPPTIDPATRFFGANGYENLWRDDLTHTLTFQGDVSSQFHPDHFLKMGVELQYHDIRYVDIQDGGINLSFYGQDKYGIREFELIERPPGPYPEFGQLRWVFNAYPLTGAFYIQDKFERETIVINAGVRMDWFMPGGTIFSEEWKSIWHAATDLPTDWNKFRYQFSPRFGISFPITVRTAVFFSYGHFIQLPELQFYYRDPYSGGLTGNPHLDFEQTILYEFGFTHQIAENWAIDIKSYARDISGQVGTIDLRAALGLPVSLYDNIGYARARGIEFELQKRYSRFTSGTLTYTVQWANGYSSSAFEDFSRAQQALPPPIRERRLGWDVRHEVVLQASLSSPKGEHINLFGLRLPDQWNLTILSRFSSGQPYTPGTNNPFVFQVTENTANGPPIYNTDLKFNKKILNTGNIHLSLFMDIYNLFNHHNIQMAYGFNPWTGEPYQFGDVFQDTQRGYDWFEMYRLMDPRQFSPGRYMQLGLKVDF